MQAIRRLAPYLRGKSDYICTKWNPRPWLDKTTRIAAAVGVFCVGASVVGGGLEVADYSRSKINAVAARYNFHPMKWIKNRVVSGCRVHRTAYTALIFEDLDCGAMEACVRPHPRSLFLPYVLIGTCSLSAGAASLILLIAGTHGAWNDIFAANRCGRVLALSTRIICVTGGGLGLIITGSALLTLAQGIPTLVRITGEEKEQRRELN